MIVNNAVRSKKQITLMTKNINDDDDDEDQDDDVEEDDHS